MSPLDLKPPIRIDRIANGYTITTATGEQIYFSTYEEIMDALENEVFGDKE